jgi:hypothetical protein
MANETDRVGPIKYHAKSGGRRITMIVDPMFFAQNHLMAKGGDKEIPMWARR